MFEELFFRTNKDAYKKFCTICYPVAEWLFLNDFTGSQIMDYLFIAMLAARNTHGITEDEYTPIYEAYSWLRLQDVGSIRACIRECAMVYEDSHEDAWKGQYY